MALDKYYNLRYIEISEDSSWYAKIKELIETGKIAKGDDHVKKELLLFYNSFVAGNLLKLLLCVMTRYIARCRMQKTIAKYEAGYNCDSGTVKVNTLEQDLSEWSDEELV